MNWIDIVIIVALIASVISGIISGFIKSLFGLIGLVLGLLLAGRFYVALGDHLGFISSQSTARFLAFFIVFLAVVLVASLLGLLLTKVISAVHLGWLNRLVGGVFGLFTGAIAIATLLVLLVKFGNMGDTISQSVLANFLVARLPIVLGLLPGDFDTVKQFLQ